MTRPLVIALAALAGGLTIAALGARQPRPRNADRTPLWRSALAQLRRLAPWLVELFAKRDVRAAVDRAGLAAVVSEREVAAARVACLLAAAALIPRSIGALPPRMLVIVIPLGLWTAAELPLMLLARRAKRRSEAIRAVLPDALDLLRACLAAGLPLRRSLALVSDHCAEPVAGEFACVAAETAFGISESTALDGLAARNPIPEIRSLVAAIRQAGRGGSPLAPVIAAQAVDVRRASNREIVERGARAGPKIQLVVSATIVPGALLALAAIAIAAIARGDLKLI